MNHKELGLHLVKRRHVLGVDQKTVAALSDVSVHTLSNIESGKGNPSLQVLCKILDTLGLELCIEIKRLS